ncbi:MAG: T9SS type A sorting domain-containing protein, partial [Prevotellaceae bacterium]|nr:T9SS type A sorting domain-containing protein [Prevotellaceae bacterium]
AEALPAGLTEGINYDNADATKTTLVMYAKDKNDALPDNVLVIGDFNDWIYSNAYQMKKDVNTGNWWLTLENLEPQREYAYQYAVKIGSNIVKISDAYAEKVLDPWNDKYISEDIYPNLKPYPDGKTDGLAAVFQTQKTEFAWSTSTLNFQKPNKKNLVIYELWIYDFTSYRSVNELINRLDYLENLGVNAIELMPICEFDGNINWGYGPNHYFAPDKAYGSPDAYKTLIDECHKRGIAIILDMVFNHATGLNPWAKLYWDSSINDVSAKNPWFNVDAVPADVDFFQDFNHDFYGTKEYFKRVLQYWLAEYKVDGFRMDVSKGFCGDANCNNRVDRINEYYDAVKSVDTDAYFILEHWYGAEEQGFVNNGMLCWGGGASMNNAYSQTAMGWLKDGEDISFSNNTSKGWVYFAESHDEERNFYKTKTWGNGNLQANEAARLSRVPLNVAFNVLLQGPKMMWQYEEMGYDFSINHCPDGTNDENCRTQPKPSPDALGWYSNSLRMSAYNKIAKLIALRTKLLPNVFINGTTSDVTLGSGQSIRKILWTYDNKKILVVGNFNVDGGTQYTGSKTYQMPAETWYNYLNNNTIQNGGMNITLQPGELLVFTNDNSIVAPDDVSFDYTSEIPYVFDENYAFIYPTFTDSYLFLETNGKVENITVFTLRGQQVLSTKNTKEINVSALESGLYLIVVTFDKRQLAFKFIRK